MCDATVDPRDPLIWPVNADGVYFILFPFVQKARAAMECTARAAHPDRGTLPRSPVYHRTTPGQHVTKAGMEERRGVWGEGPPVLCWQDLVPLRRPRPVAGAMEGQRPPGRSDAQPWMAQRSVRRSGAKAGRTTNGRHGWRGRGVGRRPRADVGRKASGMDAGARPTAISERAQGGSEQYG